jgi:TolA-binding protein
MKGLGFLTLGLTLVLTPAMSLAQKKEDIIALQRDVATLQEQLKGLQKSQDDKFAATQSMLQQAIDANGKVTSAMAALQRDIDSRLNDQQGKLVAPVATLGSKIDQMSDDFRAVGNSVAELVKRMNALDSKLSDISSAIRILQTPPTPAPVPAASAAGPSCPGTTAESLWQSARSDASTGKTQLAMKEYADYVKCYNDTANAPVAQYKIGQLYFDAGQYDDAAQAFDAVLEQFPENPTKHEAMYFKGVAQMKGGHNTDAGNTFTQFIHAYPHDDHVGMAHQNLRALGLEAKTRGGKR